MDNRLIVELLQQHLARQPEGLMLRIRTFLALRQAILDRQLPPGTRLPGTRSLARDLGLGRNTVLRAYEQLFAEGYIEGLIGDGSYVSEVLQRVGNHPAPKRLVGTRREGLSRRGGEIAMASSSSRIQRGAFMPGIPDTVNFPFAIWRRLLNKYFQPEQSHLMQYAHGGYGPLKVALAEYLHVTRMMKCSPRQILILNGTHQAIDLCARMLTDHKDTAWIEEPGYWGARNVLKAAGLDVRAIPLDEGGIAPTAADWESPPRIMCLSPSSQYPTGIVLSLERRLELLEQAERCGAWIIEDDYDNELRYHNQPLTSLFGLSRTQRVIYAGTLSKVMFPGLRLAYLVVPEDLVDGFSIGNAELYREGRMVEQAALAEFIDSGHFTSHIKRMRGIYRTRRDILLEALDSRLGSGVRVSGGHAGLQLLYYFNQPVDDAGLAADALAEGVVVRPLSLYYMDRSRAVPGLNLGFAAVPDELIRPAADKLARVIEVHLEKAARRA